MAAMSPPTSHAKQPALNGFPRLKITDRRHYRLPVFEGGDIAQFQHGVGMAGGNDLGLAAILADKGAGHPACLAVLPD